MSLSGLPVPVPGAGGKFTLAVSAAAGCAWSASLDVPWATLVPASGTGSASPVLEVDDNPDVSNTRSGSITVGGQVYRFSQANACTYTLDRTSVLAGRDAGTAIFQLTTKERCPWTVTTSEAWLRPETRSGTGSFPVAIIIDANSGDVRHAFATIAGQRVQITQEGR